MCVTMCVCVDIVHVYMSLCKVIIFMFVYRAIPQCVCKIISSLGVMRPKI